MDVCNDTHGRACETKPICMGQAGDPPRHAEQSQFRARTGRWQFCETNPISGAGQPVEGRVMQNKAKAGGNRVCRQQTSKVRGRSRMERNVRNEANSRRWAGGGQSPLPDSRGVVMRNKANRCKKGTRAGRPRHERLAASLRAWLVTRNKANSGPVSHLAPGPSRNLMRL